VMIKAFEWRVCQCSSQKYRWNKCTLWALFFLWCLVYRNYNLYNKTNNVNVFFLLLLFTW